MAEGRRFSREHEWILPEGGEGRIGITDYAQKELGDVVYVELPVAGTELRLGETFGTVESVKSVSDLYAPVTGRVVAVNAKVVDQPEILNQDPYGEGWLLKVEIADPAELTELLDQAGYEAEFPPA